MVPRLCQDTLACRRAGVIHVDVHKVLYSTIFQSSIHALDSILILNCILLNMLDSTLSGTLNSMHPVRLTLYSPAVINSQ